MKSLLVYIIIFSSIPSITHAHPNHTDHNPIDNQNCYFLNDKECFLERKRLECTLSVLTEGSWTWNPEQYRRRYRQVTYTSENLQYSVAIDGISASHGYWPWEACKAAIGTIKNWHEKIGYPRTR